MKQQKYILPESEIPRQWYNLAPDLPTPLLPPLGPDANPISPEMLAPIFHMGLIEQEVSQERWIDIPEEILDILCRWRPTPLRRAVHLEKYLNTPARIYYKDESVSPAGSHKPNTAVVQAWYNKQEGIERLTTETGAGQWGSALAFSCSLLGLECKVFMVRISFEQKPFRRIMMQTWGASCVPSPSEETAAGRAVLEKMPDTPGSLGIAISEAVEQAVTDPSGKTRYSLGSVLNHVLMHQTIIGLEAKKQLALASETVPDVEIGCAGGGSNFSGLAFPVLLDKSREPKSRSYRPNQLPVQPLPGDPFPTILGISPRRHPCCRCTRLDTLLCLRQSTPAGSATTEWRLWSVRPLWRDFRRREPIIRCSVTSRRYFGLRPKVSFVLRKPVMRSRQSSNRQNSPGKRAKKR